MIWQKMRMFRRFVAPALRYLKHYKSLRCMVRMLLIGSRYHRSAVKAYREFKDSVTGGAEGSEINPSTGVEGRCESEIDHNVRDPILLFNEEEDKYQEDEDAFYPLESYRIFDWFLTLNTGVCVYGVIRQFLPWERVFRLLDLDKPKHCYLVGKFTQLDPYRGAISQIFLWNFCVWHINWCIWQYFRHRPVSSFLTFVYQKPEDIQRIASLLEDNDNLESKVASKIASRSIKDNLLLSIMAYPRLVKLKGGQTPVRVYQLRPNRTMESYNSIANQLATTVLGLCVMNNPIIIVLAIYSLFITFSDAGYLSAYSDCDPEWAELALRTDEVSYFSFNFPTWHKIYAALMDGLVTNVIHLDILINITAVAPVATLFDFDLRIYWRYSVAKLSNLLEKIQKYRPLHDLLVAARDNLDERGERSTEAGRKLDEETCHLQDELIDYFQQLVITDAYVRDILSSGTFIWLVANSGARLGFTKYFRSDRNGSSTGFKIYWVCGLSLYTLVGGSLWDIKRQFDKSHRQVCSLAAHSNYKHKQRFLMVAEKFLNHSGFTLIGGYPFTLATYLTILNWTLTALSIVDNFL